jgi:hypothetical protein
MGGAIGVTASGFSSKSYRRAPGSKDFQDPGVEETWDRSRAYGHVADIEQGNSPSYNQPNLADPIDEPGIGPSSEDGFADEPDLL